MLPQWIQKFGKLRLLLVTTLLAVTLSNLITIAVSEIFFSGMRSTGFIMATLTPIILGMPLSFLYINLLFELHKTRSQLEILSITDELTQVYNRRFFIQQVNQSRLKAEPFSLMLMDFDNFKQINDHYGHPAGDLVLQTYAKICQKEIRKTDTFARLGGDEFALLLPHTILKEAEQIANRLLQTLSAASVPYAEETIPFSVSIGLTTRTRSTTTDHLLLDMDQALYAAKNAGKNRVAVFVRE